MQDLQLFERDLWVETSLNNKRRPYGFGAEGLVMKQHAWHSFFATRFSSVNNYDARETVQWLNESMYKAAEEARAKEMHKMIDEKVTAKLSA